MEELMQWYNQISSYERLKITDAQELYKKAVNTHNDAQKKSYMDRLILGTLYVVYGYIKRSGLELFVSSSYDMNDIISSFNEVWIKKLYNGDLLNVDKYSLLFTSTYFNEVYNNLCGDEILVNEQLGISTDCFVELLTLYIELKNRLLDIEFQDIIKEKYYDTGKLPFYTYDHVINIIPLFEIIYNNLNFDKTEEISLGKTKIYNYLRLIVNMGLMGPISNEFPDKTDMEDKILRGIVLEHFIEDVDQVFTDERMKQIIHERFGLDGTNPLYLDAVGKTHGITRERVRQIEAKALRKLRRNSNIRKYKEEN